MDITYDKLWEILKSRGMSKTQLAKKAELDIKTVKKLEKNENIRVDVLVRICGVLNCTADDIFNISGCLDEEVGFNEDTFKRGS